MQIEDRIWPLIFWFIGIGMFIGMGLLSMLISTDTYKSDTPIQPELHITITPESTDTLYIYRRP